MELAEVVLQGVKGSPALSRWVFQGADKAGNGVVIVPAGERESLVPRAAYELLSGIVDGSAISAALLPGEAGAQGRAGVVVVGRDNRRYRVLWDLQSGRRALQVQNGDKFEVITTTQAEILQAVTATVGFPQQDALKELFFCFVDDLPSRRKDEGPVPSGKFGKAGGSSSSSSSGKSGKPLPPGFGDEPKKEVTNSGKPLPPGFDFDDGPKESKWLDRPESELRARLAEITEKTSSTTDVQSLEYELDGLQKKIFEYDARLKPLVEMQRNVDALAAQLQAFAHLDGLPDDFLEQATTAQKHLTEHAGSLERLAGERERLVESADHLSDEVSGIRQRGGPRPLQAAMNDPLVKFGVAGGAAAIVVGAIGGFAVEGLRWFAFLNIPAFGAAVFGGIRLLSGLEEGASFRLKLARVDSDKKKLEERFGIDKEQIERLLQRAQLKAEQLPDVQQQWKTRADLRERHRAAAEDREAATASGDAVGIAADKDAAQSRIRDLESALQTAGQNYDGGVSAELLREKDEIEKVLRGEIKREEKKPSLDDLMGGPSSSSSSSSSSDPFASAPAQVAAYDVGQRITRVASDVLLKSIDDTMTLLGPRASQMVQALTDRRFSEVRFGAKAEVSVVDTSGAALAFVHLPAGDRDLIALALRLAAVEAYAKTSRMPVVFDRVFDTLPVEKAPLIVRVLQFLGQGTQVVCFTARRELAAAGPVVTAT